MSSTIEEGEEVFEQPVESFPNDIESIEEGEEKDELKEKKNRILRIPLALLGAVVLLYGAVLFVGYFIQNIFIFEPQRSHQLKIPDISVFGPYHSGNENISDGGRGWRVVELQTHDKVTLHNYWIHANESLKEEQGPVPDTILYLHGKDGRIDRRLTMVSELYKKRYCNIFMLSYRGYGKSDGSPSEAGLNTDAQVQKRNL